MRRWVLLALLGLALPLTLPQAAIAQPAWYEIRAPGVCVRFVPGGPEDAACPVPPACDVQELWEASLRWAEATDPGKPIVFSQALVDTGQRWFRVVRACRP